MGRVGVRWAALMFMEGATRATKPSEILYPMATILSTIPPRGHPSPFPPTPHPKLVDILAVSSPDLYPVCIGLDVTIQCPYARNVLPRAALQLSAAPNLGGHQKVVYYKTDCNAEGWDFYPCAFDTFTTPGSQARRSIFNS